MKKQMCFVAVCAYPDLSCFTFFSTDFVIDHWSDLETEGERRVKEEWAKISPHPAPQIVRFEPGHVAYVPEEKIP